MTRSTLSACILGLFLVAASPASAERVELGTRQETGPIPAVTFPPTLLERAEDVQVTVTAEPVQPLEIVGHISCTKGAETTESTFPKEVVTPPFITFLVATMREPDSCVVDGSAQALPDSAAAGTVRIEMAGNRRAPSPFPTGYGPPPTGVGSLPEVTGVRCDAPSIFLEGRTEIRGAGCSEGKLIATMAWRRPARAGHLVNVRGFLCRRASRGRWAEIHCVREKVVIDVKGRLT